MKPNYTVNLSAVLISHKNDREPFFWYVWGGLSGVYKTGTLGVPKERLSKRWTVIFHSHQNHSEEPTGTDMPLVLRHCGKLSVGKDVEKSEPSHTSGGNVNGAAALRNSLGVPQKIKQNYHVTQQFHTWKV